MHYKDRLVPFAQVSEESAESWVDEFAASGPDFQQVKAAVEVMDIMHMHLFHF